MWSLSDDQLSLVMEAAALLPPPARDSFLRHIAYAMRNVLRGYAKDKDGNLILIGTIPVPHSKDKPSPRT
jgi:hypothetical protein